MKKIVTIADLLKDVHNTRAMYDKWEQEITRDISWRAMWPIRENCPGCKRLDADDCGMICDYWCPFAHKQNR
jgi:hypothetical protein